MHQNNSSDLKMQLIFILTNMPDPIHLNEFHFLQDGHFGQRYEDAVVCQYLL